MTEGEKTTEKLTEILKRTRPSQAGRVLHENEEKLAPAQGAFAEYVRAVMKKRRVTRQEVFLKAGVPERYGYKLISGQKTTQKRDVLIRIFLAAGFSLDETQRALKLAGLSELYPRFKRDAVLMIAVNSGLGDPDDADELLKEQGFPPLAPCGED